MDATRDIQTAEGTSAPEAPSAQPPPPPPPPYIPERLQHLIALFSALEFGLSSLSLYQRAADFSSAKRAVESSSQNSFTEDHLRQILFFLPEAYGFAVKARSNGQPPILTIRKRRLPGADAVHDTLTDRIDEFTRRVHAYVRLKTDELRAKASARAQTTAAGSAARDSDSERWDDDDELRAELDRLELEMAPMPDVLEDSQRATAAKAALDAVVNADKSVTEQEMATALLAPVPADLKSLPSWLIEKVRRQEQVTRKADATSEKAQRERLLSTLPQLSDQIESLSIVKRKTTFAMQELVKSLARAPVRGKVEEQIHLLESLVPFWVTVVCSDGKEYVKLSRTHKYNVVKATLKRALASG